MCTGSVTAIGALGVRRPFAIALIDVQVIGDDAKLLASHLENFVVVNRVHRCISATLSVHGKAAICAGQVASSTAKLWSAGHVAVFKRADMSAYSEMRGVDNRASECSNVAPQMKIETIAVHAGHAVDPATGAVAAPIYLSTTFERDVEGTYSRGFMYTRNDNPNRQALERGVSMLEGGEGGGRFRLRNRRDDVDFAGAITGRSCARARRRLLRHVAIDPRNFRALGTGSRFRRHERSRCREKSAAAEHQTGLGRNAVQSAA